MRLPYLTADLPGIGGLIKQHLTDFRVEEIPAYEAKGVGTHCYILVEKRGFSTMAAADILAKAFGRKNMDIGYAGLKDKQAVTSQWFSVEHLESAKAKAAELPPA
jgi:tRNA pseudouridine13 synthase